MGKKQLVSRCARVPNVPALALSLSLKLWKHSSEGNFVALHFSCNTKARLFLVGSLTCNVSPSFTKRAHTHTYKHILITHSIYVCIYICFWLYIYNFNIYMCEFFWLLWIKKKSYKNWPLAARSSFWPVCLCVCVCKRNGLLSSLAERATKRTLAFDLCVCVCVVCTRYMSFHNRMWRRRRRWFGWLLNITRRRRRRRPSIKYKFSLSGCWCAARYCGGSFHSFYEY